MKDIRTELQTIRGGKHPMDVIERRIGQAQDAVELAAKMLADALRQLAKLRGAA